MHQDFLIVAVDRGLIKKKIGTEVRVHRGLGHEYESNLVPSLIKESDFVLIYLLCVEPSLTTLPNVTSPTIKNMVRNAILTYPKCYMK